MITKLDKLVLKAFIAPFLATFFITLLVLVIQFFWLWIDDFVGKGLGPGIILEFIWYQSATLIPLALPLAVLLSSLMTFGNLGESYELVAIKSSGISLLRIMRPLIFVMVLICGVAFMFANYIIPVANLKSRTLLGDIVYAKPAFDIKEGVFYDKLPGFSIKIGKKENDSIIKNIVIYEQTGDLQDNFIVASDGIMRVKGNKRFLEFNLKNGWRYQERGAHGGTDTEFIRLGFDEYVKQFDLAAFQFQRTSDSTVRGDYRMFSMRQLTDAIDSINQNTETYSTRIRGEVFYGTHFTRNIDTSWKAAAVPAQNTESFDELIPDSLKATIHERAVNRLSSMRANNESINYQYKEEQKLLYQHEIEWHRKISLSLACLVLFIIGAPLGSIIRKGGIANAMIASIIFFMIFYFVGNTGEKFAKEGEWSAFMGMWLATFVLTPIGFFLVYKATHDSQLFNKEYYFRMWRKLKSFIKRKA